MKKTHCLIIFLLIPLLIFSSCAVGKTSVPGSDDVKSENIPHTLKQKDTGSIMEYRIACIVTQDDNFMKTLQLGMSDAAKKLGVKVYLENTNGKLDKEIQLISSYISKGIDGICIHPVTTDVSIPALKRAEESGIRVIIAGIGINDEYNIPYIESDQWELGEKTGKACREFIEKNFGGKANIAVLNYKSQFPEQSNKRTEGFKSEIARLKNSAILTEQEAWLSEAAVLKAQNLINSHPDLDIIWSANEGGTIGATIAVKNAGKTGRVYVFGTDANEQLINMILSPDSILQSITGQQPYEIGFQSMEQLINKIKGENPDRRIIIPGIPLSRSNQEEVRKYYKDYQKLIGTE